MFNQEQERAGHLDREIRVRTYPEKVYLKLENVILRT